MANLTALCHCHAAATISVGGVAWRDMTDKLTPEQIAGLTGLLFMYNRFIADITIAIIRLKQAFDGAQDATENKYPV